MTRADAGDFLQLAADLKLKPKARSSPRKPGTGRRKNLIRFMAPRCSFLDKGYRITIFLRSGGRMKYARVALSISPRFSVLALHERS